MARPASPSDSQGFEALAGLVASWPLALVDAEGRVLVESPRMREVLGWDPQERRGRSIFELVHPDDVEIARELVERLAASPGSSVMGAFRARHQDGSWRLVEVEGRNLLDDELVAGIVLTARDVTERRTLEQRLAQAERMEAVGRLAGGIAHDFNNLMTTVRGRVELLLEQAGGQGPFLEGLVEIQRAAERAAKLTRKLLAFSRRQLLEPETVALNEAIRASEEALRQTLGEGIELALELDPGVGAVRVDRGQLDQVLLHLLFNAREAMPQGGRVTIRTANEELGPATTDQPYVVSGAYVLLEVSDEGVGMDDETTRRAFEPFFTTKEKVQGKGLGLSMVYGVVKQSRGYVWLDSEPGRGTTVRVYLPCAETAGEPAAEAARAADAGGARDAVLVVEDEESVRSLVRAVLGRRGYRVVEAASADEALRTVERHPGAIRLVLTDIVMPGLGGQELIERLAADHPGLRFILMSGYTDDPRVRSGLEERRIPFLAKPFTPRALLEKVETVLGGRAGSPAAG